MNFLHSQPFSYDTIDSSLSKERYGNFMKKMKHLLRFGGVVLFALFISISFSENFADAKPGDSYSAEKAIAYADSCFKKKGNSYKVHYSKKYGKDLCAGYVSQCLKEGGLPMDSTWYWKSKKKTSLTWRVSKMLFSYLKKSGYKVIYSPSASQVKPGDIIFYWTNGGWGHCSICVAKKADGTPRINSFNDAHYHFSYWTLGYKTCVISMENKVETPTLTQTTINGGKRISLSCDTDNATIYYTTNGKTPTKKANRYTKPFIVNKNTTVKAVATYHNYKNSNTLSKFIDTKKVIENGIYYIHTSHSKNKVLGVPGNSLLENATLQLMNSNSEYNRKFSVTYKGNGYYTLFLLHSGHALTDELITNKNKKNGTPVQKKFNQTPLGLWRISFMKAGCLRITNAKTGRHLSIGKTIQTGNPAYTSSTTENVGQLWNFKKTSRSKLVLKHCIAPRHLKKKSSFVFSGTISSNYKIQSVTVSILNKAKKTVASASASPRKKTYSIRKLSGKIYFGKLKTGTYRFQITATDTTKQKKMLMNKSFKVKKR